jgi:SAM-dependent methyltransferase
MTFHHLPDKTKALNEMYRVLKPGGQVALHFNGGPCFKEIIESGLVVAGRYPEFPGFMDAVVEFRGSFLGLEDMTYLMEESGFVDHMTYGRQVVVFVDPMRIPFIGYSWDFWEPGLPVGVRGKVRSELIDYYSECSGVRGFKFLYSTIVSVGNKTNT